MRVVQLGKYYPPATGGIESHTQTLCRSLVELGVDVRVVVVNHLNAAGQDVTFSTTARTPSQDDADGTIKIHRVGRIANVAKLDITPSLPKLLRHLQRDPPDIWHLHAPNITMMLALAAMPSVKPLVITHHSDIVRQKVLKHGVRPLEKLIYRRAARILTDSPPYANGSDLLAPLMAKVTAMPLGIDLKPYATPSPQAQEIAAALRTKYGSPLWLIVGRLIYYKAIDIAIDALVRLPGRLMVIGRGPLEEALKAKTVQAGVADRVIWLGRASSDELVGAYLAATAHWFPSNARAEAFGLVQVEAMAAGCPVINTAIAHSGVPWVSLDNVSGLTVPINDAVGFAAAAKRLLDEPGLRERLSAGARARAATEFDQQTMARRCQNIYAECLRN